MLHICAVKSYEVNRQFRKTLLNSTSRQTRKKHKKISPGVSDHNIPVMNFSSKWGLIITSATFSHLLCYSLILLNCSVVWIFYPLCVLEFKFDSLTLPCVCEWCIYAMRCVYHVVSCWVSILGWCTLFYR